jgi:hypothetical protein
MFDSFKADCAKAWDELIGHYTAIKSPLARVGVAVAVILVLAMLAWAFLPLLLLLAGAAALAFAGYAAFKKFEEDDKK